MRFLPKDLLWRCQWFVLYSCSMRFSHSDVTYAAFSNFPHPILFCTPRSFSSQYVTISVSGAFLPRNRHTPTCTRMTIPNGISICCMKSESRFREVDHTLLLWYHYDVPNMVGRSLILLECTCFCHPVLGISTINLNTCAKFVGGTFM